MMRSILLLAAMLPLCWSAVGCRSCQGTNDYCGPLPDEPCDFFYRRNSILGGDLQTHNPETDAATATDSQQENVPTPAPEQGSGMPNAPAPEPMPPDSDLPPEMDLPPDSNAPANSDAPPESELPPGASLHHHGDPYARQPHERPRGILGSLFGRRR